MKAALITGQYVLEIRDFSFPELAGPTQAVVEILKTGICGSDVTAFRDGEAYPPFLSGHEWVGRVISVGSEVTHLKVGDRVVAGTPAACGNCQMCRRGHGERCIELTALAFGTHPHTPQHGGYAERIEVPAEILIPIPSEIGDEAAAMIEPAAVALHAIRRHTPRMGDVVVVVGAGPVGLFAVQMLRQSGAARVIVIEPQARRQKLALSMGADSALAPGPEALEAIQDATHGLGADIVYDCVGNEKALTAAVEYCRSGATLVMIGATSGAVKVSPLAWLGKELTIATSLAHLNHEFPLVIDLMARGRLNTEALVDETIGLGDLEKVLTQLASGLDRVKVLVDARS